MNVILLQAFYYAVVMALSVMFLGFIMKGFLFKFLKVKMSFGKYVLVKLRGINRDFFQVGWIEEGFLVYKANKEEKRVSLEDNSAFYRSVGVSWIDIDEQKSAICKTDYKTIEGFDSVKYNNLYKRALTRPVIASNKEKIIMVLLIGIAIAIVFLAYMVYTQDANIQAIQNGLNSILTKMSSSVDRVAI